LAIKYLDAKRIRGLSSDTKPTNVPENTLFEETDTRNVYGLSSASEWDVWYYGVGQTPLRGVFMGGEASGVVTMDYITIDTLGNATDFGDLTSGRSGIASGVSGFQAT